MNKICCKSVNRINEILRPTAFVSDIQSLLDLGKLDRAVDLALSHPVHFHHHPYLKLLHLCIDKQAYNQARMVHEHLYSNGLRSNLHINTKLVILYSKSGDMKTARIVFDEMPERSVVSWTALLSGYARNGYDNEAVKVFRGLHRAGVKANQFTYASTLSACARLRFLNYGLQIQGCIHKGRFFYYSFVQCALIELHSKCGDIKDACYIFDIMSVKDLVSWNSMIGGFAVRGFNNDAILMFRLMLRDDMTPDNFTLASVLMACARSKSLANVTQLHVYVSKLGFGSYNSINGSLINAYSKSGSVRNAYIIYKSMINKDTISCTALIAGFANEGSHTNPMEAMNLFIELQLTFMNIDSLILCSMINVCANSASLGLGKQMHSLSLKSFALPDVPMCNALIDMYSKCGEIIDARQVFDEIHERNIISWTSLIAGYGKHGYGVKAISLYKQMVDEGFEPNGVTFLSLLFSCSHNGLTEEGKRFFNSMVNKYNITPQEKHYSCMVDLLARGGELEEACDLVSSMHIKPNASIWGAILGGCSVHGDVALGEVAARHLFDLDPTKSVNYVVLAGIYAAAGLWDGAWDTRKLMTVENLQKKQSGCSFFQLTSKRLLLS